MSLYSSSALSSASPLSPRAPRYKNNNDQISQHTRSQHALQRVSKKRDPPVRYVTIPVTRYPLNEAIKNRADYLKLDFGQQYLYFIPESMNERDRPPIENFQKRLFYEIPGLIERKCKIIPQCILYITKLIKNDTTYNNEGDNSSDDDEDSIRAILNEDDDIYDSGPVNIRALCKRNVCDLLNALKYNHTYDGSFRVTSEHNYQKYSYCPFSKHMQPWIDFYGLDHLMGKAKYQASQCNCKKMDRVAFENHLKAKARSCVLHACVHDYLISLYGLSGQISSFVLGSNVRCTENTCVQCTGTTSVPDARDVIVRKEQAVNADQPRVGSVLVNNIRIKARGSFVESRTEKSDVELVETKANQHNVDYVLSDTLMSGSVYRCSVALQYYESKSFYDFFEIRDVAINTIFKSNDRCIEKILMCLGLWSPIDDNIQSIIWVEVLRLFIKRHLGNKSTYSLGSRNDSAIPDMNWYCAILKKGHDFLFVWQNNSKEFYFCDKSTSSPKSCQRFSKLQTDLCLLSLVSAIYVKQNIAPMIKSPSSSHCVLNGKDDRDHGWVGNDVLNKGCVTTSHTGWSSSTTNTLMNERLTKSRDHGWSNGWTSNGGNKSGDWSIPAHSKPITKVSNSNKSNDLRDKMDQSFQFEKPHPVITKKSDEPRVHSCLGNTKDISNVLSVPDGNLVRSRVVQLKSDVRCVQSGKMVDCAKNSTDDSSSLTFEEENQISSKGGNQLKRKHSMRDVNRARVAANHKFDNYKKTRCENSWFQPYSSNANSSVRTKVAAKVIYNVHDIVQKDINSSAPLKNMLATERKRVERGRNKDKKINLLPLIQTCTNKIISKVDLQGSNKFFLDIGVEGHKDCNELQIFDSKEGGIHWINKERGLFSALLVPRKDAIPNDPNVKQKIQYKVVVALQKLHRTEKGIVRGKSKEGISTTHASYCVYGLKTMRGATGFSRDKLSSINKEASNTLTRMIKRCQDVLKAWIETSWLIAIHRAFELGCWKGVDNAMYCGLATSYDFYAASHTDDDMGIAIHQVNVYMDYRQDDEIVQYFCFPEYGFCVALRPGDWLLFNPAVHHCLSQKSKTYSNEIVHVSTCYVKTSHVGGNDNSIPLNSFEENYALYDLGD